MISMKHPAATLALVLAFVTLVPAGLRAEYRRVELAIAGMD